MLCLLFLFEYSAQIVTDSKNLKKAEVDEEDRFQVSVENYLPEEGPTLTRQQGATNELSASYSGTKQIKRSQRTNTDLFDLK
jgi:hypothetical protein